MSKWGVWLWCGCRPYVIRREYLWFRHRPHISHGRTRWICRIRVCWPVFAIARTRQNGQTHNEYIKGSACYVTVPAILYMIGSKSITVKWENLRKKSRPISHRIHIDCATGVTDCDATSPRPDLGSHPCGGRVVRVYMCVYTPLKIKNITAT